MSRTSIQSYKMTRTIVLSGLCITVLLGSTAVEALAAAGSFALTGSLNTARYGHTATLLPNGDVLVAGGLGVNGSYAPLASAEIYNQATGKWTVTSSMSVGRMAFTATLLPNGEVLVAGGSTYAASCFATAELYNPSTGQWKPTGSMAQPRCLHVATLLTSGDVLVAGGVESDFGLQRTVATAELYNPSTGVWQITGSLNVARVTSAALLQSGQVLVAGGYNTSNSTTTYLASAELYDPFHRALELHRQHESTGLVPHYPCTAYERRCAGKQRRPILQSRHGRLDQHRRSSKRCRATERGNPPRHRKRTGQRNEVYL